MWFTAQKDIANYIFDEMGTKMEEKMGTVPPSFQDMRNQYLRDIERNRKQIETAFQLRLNEGFARLFWFYTILSLTGILLLAGLPSKKKIDEKIALESKAEQLT